MMRILIPTLAVLALLVVLFFLIDPPDRKAPGIPVDRKEPTQSMLPDIEKDVDRVSLPPASLHENEEELDHKPMDTVGWQAWGMVSDEEGNPVEGAKVCLQYQKVGSTMP